MHASASQSAVPFTYRRHVSVVADEQRTIAAPASPASAQARARVSAAVAPRQAAAASGAEQSTSSS